MWNTNFVQTGNAKFTKTAFADKKLVQNAIQNYAVIADSSIENLKIRAEAE